MKFGKTMVLAAGILAAACSPNNYERLEEAAQEQRTLSCEAAALEGLEAELGPAIEPATLHKLDAPEEIYVDNQKRISRYLGHLDASLIAALATVSLGGSSNFRPTQLYIGHILDQQLDILRTHAPEAHMLARIQMERCYRRAK